MAKFTITVPQDQIEQLEAALGRQSTKQAIYQAVFRTTRAGTTAIRTEIQRDLNISTKYVQRAVTTQVRGGDVDADGIITVKDDPIPMIAYADKKFGGGVTAIISKNRLPLVLRHAFVVTVGRGSHTGIFFRAKGRDKSGDKKGLNLPFGRLSNVTKYEGGKLTKAGYARRLPIEELFGPSVLSAIGEKVLTATGQRVIDSLQDTLIKNLQSQVDRFLGRSKKVA